MIKLTNLKSKCVTKLMLQYVWDGQNISQIYEVTPVRVVTKDIFTEEKRVYSLVNQKKTAILLDTGEDVNKYSSFVGMVRTVAKDTQENLSRIKYSPELYLNSNKFPDNITEAIKGLVMFNEYMETVNQEYKGN